MPTVEGIGFSLKTVNSVTIDLTAAQIAGLQTSQASGLTVLAAQGAGTVIIPVMGVLQYSAGSVAFTNARTLRLSWAASTSFIAVSGANIGFNGLTSQLSAFTLSASTVTLSDGVNSDLVLIAAAGSVGGSGNGTGRLVVYYVVMPLRS